MLNMPYIWGHARRLLGFVTVVLWTLMVVVDARLAAPELSKYTWAIHGLFLICIIAVWQTSDFESAKRQERHARKNAGIGHAA